MSKKILVIDDDELILKSIASIGKHENWITTTCQNAEQGLQEIQEQEYDCIILDIRMPNMTGPEMLAELRQFEEKKEEISNRVIIITGFADEDAHIKVFQRDIAHYLTKPFDIKDLIEKVNQCYESRQAQKAFVDESISELDDEKEFKKIRKLYDANSINQKVNILERRMNLKLKHLRGCTYDTELFKGNIENPFGIVQIPLGLIGPLKINGKHAQGEFFVPMATSEGALLLTYDLGSRLTSISGGIKTDVLSKTVHISPMFIVGEQNEKSNLVSTFIKNEYQTIKEIAEGGSSHTKLLKITCKQIKDNLVTKFEFDTGDAQGLNMINQAAFQACKYIESKTNIPFLHRSHYSGIKHYSPLNEKEGQGRVVKAKAVITSKALSMLRVNAIQLKDFFDRCITCGNSAGIRSVNVHAANAVTAIFLACGQDPADMSCSHVCETTGEIVNGKDFAIECTLKNLLVATVGGGTVLGTQSECLQIMDCSGSAKSDKLAEIIAATVLAGEVPTAAAVISRTYVDIHNKYGRNKTRKL